MSYIDLPFFHWLSSSASSDAVLIAGSLATLAMPGPTNTLLATAGLTQGMKRAGQLTCAEFAGYLVSISILGLLFDNLANTLGWLPALMKIAASLYLVFLAVRIWRSAAPDVTSLHGAIGQRALFFATLFNPKALLFASAIFPATAFTTLSIYIKSMAIFAAIQIPVGMAWIALGAELGRGRLMAFDSKLMQRCASIVLVFFSSLLTWAAIGAYLKV